MVTDHQALRWLWRLKDPSGRLARWVMELSQYNFTVIHRPGATIPHADALSRDDGSASVGKEPADGLSCSDGTRSVSRGLQCERESSDSEAAGREPTKGLSSGGGTSRKLVHGLKRNHELSVRDCTCAAAADVPAASRAVGVEDSDRPSANSAVGERPTTSAPGGDTGPGSALPDCFDLPTELQRATAADPVLSEVTRCIESGGDASADVTSTAAGRFYIGEREHLFVRDGLVCRQKVSAREAQILVPESVQCEIIRLAHDVPLAAHFGVDRTVHQITRRYFWFNLKNSVREYCRSCLGCARVKRPNFPHREGIEKVPVFGEPFAQWSADILGPLPRTESGNAFVLVVSDLFTKWVETYCIPDQKATTVADCFVDLISRFGVPKSILTDKGTNFERALVRRICEMLGITKLRCTAAHPQTDGQTERFNRTLCDMLTHYVNENRSDWDRWVGVCASAFRFSRHTTTGYSPFELVYGAEPRVPVVSEMLDDASELRCGTYGQYVDGLKRRLSVDRAQAHKSLVERQTRSSVPSASDIQLGDKVMLKVHAVKRGHVKKLSNRFEGPYVVAEVRRPDYVIKRGRKTRFVHGSNIKKVHASICDDADTPDRPRSVPTTVQKAGVERCTERCDVVPCNL